MDAKRIIIVDGYSFVFRAYHAMPALSRPEDGTPVGAVYGFISMVMRVLLDMKPTHIVIALDSGKKTYRHKMYPKYKANRPPAPEDLVPQFPLIREAIKALNIETMEQEGYEADDIIATLAHKALKNKEEVLIISSDKDLMGLVNDHTKMYDAIRSKEIGAKEVEEKYGVEPEKMRDLLAVVGDTSDNVPGIPGIGPKTAAELLNKFNDIEGIYKNLDQIKQPKRKQALIDNKETLTLSRKLVTLVHDLSLDLDFNDLKAKEIDSKQLLDFLHKQGFRSLAARAKKEFGVTDGENTDQGQDKSIFDPTKIKSIYDLKSLKEVISKANYYGKIAFYFQTNFDSYEEVKTIADIHSIAITIGTRHLYYIPLVANESKQPSLLELDFAQSKKGLLFLDVIKHFADILQDNSILKIFYDYKKFLHLVSDIIDVNSIDSVDDIMLMSYDLGSGRNNTSYHKLMEFYLKENNKTIGGGITKSRGRFTELNEREKTNYIAKQSHLIYEAHKLLQKLLFESHQQSFYQQTDRILSKIVYKMESIGFKVNQAILLNLAKELDSKIDKLSQEIYKIVGTEFNIASSQQLSDVLFNKMGIAANKKSKTGSYKTSIDILENLQAQGHTIADLLIEWRKLYKMKTTYTTSLVNHISKKSGRIHSNFSLAYTATGRFSSTEPNLQNIPVRGDFAEQVRSAFVAGAGCKILSADYSQIELRLLAEIGDIKSLKEAFKKDLDIHATTASEVFNVDINKITPALRKRAKAINFGIIYGISAYGLAKNLGIPRHEAGDYIKRYFEKYPGILEYMEKSKKFAHEHGYIETITGRRCYVDNIHTQDNQLRSFAERAAINFPLQGSSADIMRKAMVSVTSVIQKEGLDCKLLLQIHDELLFEVKESQIDKAGKLIKNAMENVLRFSIPIIVDITKGDTWHK
jgi:DNA polymerase I